MKNFKHVSSLCLITVLTLFGTISSINAMDPKKTTSTGYPGFKTGFEPCEINKRQTELNKLRKTHAEIRKHPKVKHYIKQYNLIGRKIADLVSDGCESREFNEKLCSISHNLYCLNISMSYPSILEISLWMSKHKLADLNEVNPDKLLL